MTALVSETLPDPENKSTGIAEIEKLQSVHKEIAKRLDYYEAVAKKAREAEHLSNVKLRRQGELLQDALKSADAALKQNADLRLRLDSLGKVINDLSDEEANKTTNQLYDDLENWVKRHYGALQPVYPEIEPDVDLDQQQEFWLSIYGDLSQKIFHIILSRFMVGTGSPGMNHALRMLDEKVQGTSKAPEISANIGVLVQVVQR
ncbi:hypothetical protein N7513_010710 [Penicillium frequentans]|nr:hypothetical protein N7513_010710 [Penicillium glabrum]